MPRVIVRAPDVGAQDRPVAHRHGHVPFDHETELRWRLDRRNLGSVIHRFLHETRGF